MIVVGGECLIDFIQMPAGAGLPTYQATPGGSPYNCAKALGLQEIPAGYLTPMSTDTMGELLADGLTQAGVTVAGERRPEPSPLALVSLQDGAASYQFYREGTADRLVTKATLNANLPNETSGFHLGSLAITQAPDADIWADFYIALHSRNVFTSLDPNIRAAFISDRKAYLSRLNSMLAATDLLKLSDEDLSWLVPGVSLQDAAQDLFARSGAKLMVVTLGAQGAFALHKNQLIKVGPAPVRDLKDTVGAGDTFMATLLSGLYQSQQLSGPLLGEMGTSAVKKLLHRAARAAALNCEKTGCNPPTYSELEAAMNNYQTGI